ncbi:aminotransferase class I/II-fold pyridoxal phosphate-dependent enzyme [Rhodopseudomonas boonkerdii]|uniref:aminotransferase class I/II-fold pyridoxal phosphate-dependent enzyme n=1 Tax=Rhodopseudomonas boonkerdii TaxID=475937 RepID=UPI001E3FACC8|nr:aminotransferase class I/II-fold pyridoxal phosphate-dependent enzyme [Rhodopseudomonas boonkerdii]UGV28370.1 aminotransferase class I/II-fold pyridoxal phosphate-dependent enzyme [Rhodopseudomonas boonkerdii]
MIALSPRLREIAASPAARLRQRARELREAGRDIIELSSGNVDFPTPDHVIAAAHAAALRGETRYTDADGTPALKAAISTALRRDHGLDYDHDEIVATSGSTVAIFLTFFATLSPGDEVIVPSPYWAPYLDQVRLAGGTPVIVPCPQNNGYRLRPADLAAAISERTRWLIINNPVNPSGAVYSRDDLAALADVLLHYPNIGIIADGLYEHFAFEAAATLAQVQPRLKPRIVTVSGVAKTYGMMGWRLGYAAGPKALMSEIRKLLSQTTSCPSSISQAAAIAALTGPQDLRRERLAILVQRRDRFVARLNRCGGLSCTAPEGTFFLVVSCSGLIGKHTPAGQQIVTDRDVAAYLLDAAGVSVVAGEDYGASPSFRVNFSNPDDLLDGAADLIEQACEALQ